MHPREDDSTEAGAGKAVHAGYQEWLKSQDRDKADFELMMNYPFQLNSMEDHDRSIYACYSTLNALIQAAPLIEYEIARINVDGQEKDCVEVAFEFQIENFNLSEKPGENIPVTYVGKIDAVLFNRATTEYGVFDIKTHRRNIKDLSPMYVFDEQCIPYALVIERLLGHELESVNVSYLSCFLDLEKPRVVPYPFVKPKGMIEDWAKRLMLDLQQIKFYYNTQWFPRSSNACMNFNRRCAFMDVCQTRDAETIQAIILSGQEGEFKNLPKEDGFGKPWVTMKLDLGF